MADLSTLGLGGDISGQTNGLEQLATMIMANNQPRDTAPRMIGNLGRDVTPQGGVNAIAPTLTNMAQNYLMMQQMQKRNQFMKSINDVMGSNSPIEDSTSEDGKTTIKGKKQQLLQILTANPDLVKDSPLEDVQNTLMKEFAKPSGSITLRDGTNIPAGMEVVGYDQKGQPMIRKVKTNVAEQKFNLDQEEKKKQQELKSQFVKDSAIDTLNTISEVEKGINNFGLFGQVPSIPGTKRADWEANINNLLSRKVIDVMTSMKEASKTGATGFGQLSEKELKVLQDASTALKRGLSPKDAQKYLNDMKDKLYKLAQIEIPTLNKGKTKSGMGFTISR